MTRRIMAVIVVLAVTVVVAGCSAASTSSAPSAAAAASVAVPASSEPTSAPSASEAAPPASGEVPSAEPSVALPSFVLPNDDKGLEALLPAKLCGKTATRVSYSGERFKKYPDATLTKTVAQLGKTVDDVAMAISTLMSSSGTCHSLAGVFQVKGADPGAFRDYFIAQAKKEDQTIFTQGNVAGHDVYIGVKAGDATKTYAYFKGDALFFVVATDDAAAAPLLEQMP